MSREKNPKKQQTLLALGFSMIKKGKTVVGDFADESQIKVCRICKKNLHNMGAFVNHMMWKHQIRITPDGSEREQCGVQQELQLVDDENETPGEVVASWLGCLVENVVHIATKNEAARTKDSASKLRGKRKAPAHRSSAVKLARRSYRCSFKSWIISKVEDGVRVRELCERYKTFNLSKSKISKYES